MQKDIHLRFRDFSVPYLVDETLREGVERTAFPITAEAKINLLRKMTGAGLRDFVVGCGPEQPIVWEKLHQEREAGTLPSDTKATFIVLLNCWETAYDNFRRWKDKTDWIADTVFSFGMVTHREREKAFDRAVTAFRELGAIKLKASVLNNFRHGVSEEHYQEVCRQIDWAISLGVKTIRINDSLGSLQPHTARSICSRLVQQYPGIVFCLHAHNDAGLAVANTIESIQAGFQMVEGSLAGLGNRSGIAPIEQVVKLCKVNNIRLGEHEISLEKLVEAARACEEAFLQVPNVYRPVGGIFETDSNFGVLNIPDFLETDDKKEYFVNYLGLHPHTVRKALQIHFPQVETDTIPEDRLWEIVHRLRKQMEGSIHELEDRYKKARRNMMEFYRSSTYTTKQLADYAYEVVVRH